MNDQFGFKQLYPNHPPRLIDRTECRLKGQMRKRRSRFFRVPSATTLVALFICIGVACPHGVILAQQGALPRREYYPAVYMMYAGEFENAGKRLNSMSKGAYQDQYGRFMDSICYWTMTAENHFRLGQYPQAIELYEASLSLYASLQDWPTRTRFPDTIRTDQAGERRSEVPWAKTSRRFSVGNFDNTLPILIGNSPEENERVLREGGVFDPERYRSVNMAEVMRCVALAAHRRHIIKGAICVHDPFTKEIAATLHSPTNGTNMAGAWQGIAKGMVLASLEDWEGASRLLNQSLQVGGNYDHPLTPIALLKLGYIAERQERWNDAVTMYLEASISAAVFEQFDLIDESLGRATNIHLLGRTATPLPALADAIVWAKSSRLKPLHASLLMHAATVAAESGAGQQAIELLAKARKDMTRNDLRKSRQMLRFSYIGAMAQFAEQKMELGHKRLQEFYADAATYSLWLYQLRLADELVRNNQASDRESDRLYGAVLREPTDFDWLLEPIETLAYQTTPHYDAIERWFQIALNRKADDKAVALSEFVRRQRFFSTLPLGGRLMGLRWTLECADESLPSPDFAYRDAILARFTEYRDASALSKSQRDELMGMPLQLEQGSPEKLQQSKLMQQWLGTSRRQENLLYQIALQREPCPLSFPPLRDNGHIQSLLEPGQVIVSLLRVGDSYYVMTLNNQNYAIEGIVPAKSFDRNIRKLLQQMGVTTGTAINSIEKLEENAWKSTAKKLTQQLFPKANDKYWESVKEIIFVPDSIAWYLPFEVLQIDGPDPEQTVSLDSKVNIRYAPTMALAVPDQRVLPRFPRVAIVARSNFLRDSAEVIQEELIRLQDEKPGIVQVQEPLVGPSSLLSATIDQLIVWHTTDPNDREGHFSMMPFGYQSDSTGNELLSWMQLPWNGPQQLVLSGFSSKIEGKQRSKANGDDLFLATCGLMSSGIRTVLISRWRVGGQSTLDLTREFALQMGQVPAMDAWRRSVDLLRDSELDLQREPRIREKMTDKPVKAEHPFFWAGYMLLDTGAVPPTNEDAPAAKAAIPGG